jgi:hypothetical protein
VKVALGPSPTVTKLWVPFFVWLFLSGIRCAGGVAAIDPRAICSFQGEFRGRDLEPFRPLRIQEDLTLPFCVLF